MAVETPASVPEGTEAPFKASSTLAASLQQVLADQVELHLQAKQAHWNLVGPGFREIHLQLDEITEGAREAADTIAERLRALAGVADGRSTTVSKTTSLSPLPEGEQTVRDTVAMMEVRIAQAGKTIREVHDDIDEEDPSSADLLHNILNEAEKQAWMLRSAIREASQS